MQYDQLYEQNRLSSHALRYCGFEEAPSSTLPYYLYKAQLKQQASCLRDTLIVALKNYQKLQNILLQAGTAKKWKFYHIILCSIPDTVSKIKRKETIEQIVRLNSMWQVAAFKTFFIPICMSDHDIQEIMTFCEFGGPDWVSYPTNYEDFQEQFKYVMGEVGMAGKNSLLGSESNEDHLLGINPFENFSVAMTLSVQASQMMRGEKWEGIVGTISFYLRNLSKRDIMSGIIFSTQPWVVGQINQEQQLPQIAGQEQIVRQPQPRNVRVDQPQYQAYAQPVPQQNNAGRNCGYCCVVLFVLFIIRLIIYLAVS